MSQTKHTPGPWSVFDYKEGGLTVVSDTHGAYVAKCDGISATIGSAEELMANARLIAAAPDLLRLLEDAIPYIEEGEQFNKPSCRGLSKAARAAIAMATGKIGGGA